MESIGTRDNFVTSYLLTYRERVFNETEMVTNTAAVENSPIENPSQEKKSLDPITEFSKRLEWISSPEEKQKALEVLKASEEVKEVFMSKSETELNRIQGAFGTFLTDVVINAELLKAGVDVREVRQAGWYRGGGKLHPGEINILDKSGRKNYLKDQPLKGPSQEDLEVIKNLATELGVSESDLAQLRGTLSFTPAFLRSRIIVTPNNLNQAWKTGRRVNPLIESNPDFETDDLERARALGIEYPSEPSNARELITAKLTEINATDEAVFIDDREGHINIKIQLAEDKRDLAHYAVVTSTLLAQSFISSNFYR